uniref:Polymeric immunoglobulin receptor n=1 Tax=Salvator merianae TaxID=96440 RepID=A0A8D0BNR4_SALMN
MIILLMFVYKFHVRDLDSIFGPREVTGLLKGSVTVKCFYPHTTVNRHSRKYWCKESTRQCSTIVSSNGYVDRKYDGRASITDFPENGIFLIEISNLEKRDMGTYKCGIGLNDKGLSFRVKLDVSEGKHYIFNITLFSNIHILFKMVQIVPRFVKKIKNILNEFCWINFSYMELFLERKGKLAQSWLVCIDGFPLGMSGQFYLLFFPRCDKRNIVNTDSVMPEEAELFYVEKGGSVTMTCDFGEQYEDYTKYLCKMTKTDCLTVFDTRGNIHPSYKGRVLLSYLDVLGSFNVMMTNLQKGDSGLNPHTAKSVVCILYTLMPLAFVSGALVPKGQPVLNGVQGGSVSVECHYDPKGNASMKYLCKWREHGCKQLINSLGYVIDSHEGRITMFDNEENGTFTVILNQLKDDDAGYYWCMTDGNQERKSTTELKIVEGKPSLVVENEIQAIAGSPLTLSCSYPCAYEKYEKYWCKWKNTECKSLNLPDQNQTGLVVNCDKGRRILSLNFDQVTPTDQGWYWCGVKHGEHYGETAAVDLQVQAGDVGDSKNSTVLLSTLIPIGVVFLLLVAVGFVMKFRLFQHSDLVSVGSYRTNISMTDFENARQYGAKDNVCMEGAQETRIGKMDGKQLFDCINKNSILPFTLAASSLQEAMWHLNKILLLTLAVSHQA